jgi:hypothetical protein
MFENFVRYTIAERNRPFTDKEWEDFNKPKNHNTDDDTYEDEEMDDISLDEIFEQEETEQD